VRLRGALVVTVEREQCAAGDWIGGALVSVHEPTGVVRVARCRCKQRGCERCDKAKAGKLAARAAPVYGKMGALLLTGTLGAGEHAIGPIAALDALRGVWRTFTDALFRAYPWLRRYPYVACFEPHKSGIPHIHAVLGYRWFPIAVLQRFWTAAGGGNMDLQGSKRGRNTNDSKSALAAVWYALKYAAKGAAWGWDMLEYLRVNGIRTVMMSRNIPPVNPVTPDGWQWFFVSVTRVAALFGLSARDGIVIEEGSPYSGPPRAGPADPEQEEAAAWLLGFVAQQQ